MKHVLTLRSFPSMREAHRASDLLHEAFVKELKRKPKVELYLSSGPSPKRAAWDKKTETVEIRCYHEAAEKAEADWMLAKAATL